MESENVLGNFDRVGKVEFRIDSEDLIELKRDDMHNFK